MWHFGIMIGEMMDGHTWGSSQFMKAGMYMAAKARTTMKGAVSAVRTMVRKVLRSRRWSDEVSWKSDDVSMRERTVAAMLTFIALNTPQKRPIDRPSPAEITVIIQASTAQLQQRPTRYLKLQLKLLVVESKWTQHK